MWSLTLMRYSIRTLTYNAATIAAGQKLSIISRVTGLKTSKVRFILSDFSLKGLSYHPLEHFRRIDEIFQNQKLASCTVSETRDLFTTSYFALRQKIRFLQSCGIEDMKASHILSLELFMNTPIEIFKALTNLDPSINFVDKWISLLDSSSQKEAYSILEGIHTQSLPTISKIRNTIFACHLASRWNVSFTEALKVVECGIKNQPHALERLLETLDTLLEKGYDKGLIAAHPEVLCSEARSIHLFLEMYSNDFLGQPGFQFLKNNPKLVSKLDFDILHENVTNLLQANIPIETIRSQALILLNYDPYLLADRLKSFSSFPELIVFARNPSFPQLLENMESVIIRMETLRSIDPRLICFRLLTCRSQVFMKLIHSGKILFVLSTDVLRYLETFTGENAENIRNVLSTHPHYRNLSVATMREVIELLVDEQFTPEQIFEGIHLILYPAALVKKKLAALATQQEMQPFEIRRTEKRFLHFLIYFIESDYDFSGSGVFAKQRPTNPTLS